MINAIKSDEGSSLSFVSSECVSTKDAQSPVHPGRLRSSVYRALEAVQIHCAFREIEKEAHRGALMHSQTERAYLLPATGGLFGQKAFERLSQVRLRGVRTDK
jgi:hypothetical protein